MKTVMEKCNINARVRLILGLNEEKNWLNCLNEGGELLMNVM